MHIVFATHSLGYGGVEKNIKFLSEKFVSTGNQVDIIYIEGIIPEYMCKHVMELDKRIKVYSVEASNIRGVRRFVQIFQFTKLLNKIKPDIIIGFTIYPNVMSVLAGKILHIPTIISERGDPYREFCQPTRLQKIELSIINRSNGAVFQTEGAKNFYSKRLQKYARVIPNPIFSQGHIERNQDGCRNRTVVSVGRLDNIQKRYDVMLGAFSLFIKKHPDYTLKIYGDGKDLDFVLKKINELQIGENVKLCGVVKNPMSVITNEGIYLITSDFEGIPNSLLEAMAAGLPVVSTDCSPGGARMLITDHENGLLTPIRDEKALSNALCEFAENPKLAEICGNNAKDVLKRFAPDGIFGEWNKYVKTLIK